MSKVVRGTPAKYVWLTTMPNIRTANPLHPDAGQSGWKLHLVDETTLKKSDWREGLFGRSLCGVRARHGWGLDMFINAPCQRCLKRAERL